VGLGSFRQTVLVTGAAGFIGSHLVERLLAEGYEVVGLDNLMTGDLTNLAHARRDPHFHLEIGDVREPLPVYAEIIFNLACPASPVHYQADPFATVTTSALGAIRLVDQARRSKCRLVHASTSEVYGDPLEHPQREEYWGHVNCAGERACYDEGKRVAETILMDERRTHGADVRIVRIFNTYGPRMQLNDGRVVPNFMKQALRGEDLTVYGDGNQTRSFCYVSDEIDGFVRLAKAAEHLPVNIGNPNEFTILECAELVIKVIGSKSRIRHEPLPQDDPKQRRPDITKARQLLQQTDKLIKTFPEVVSVYGKIGRAASATDPAPLDMIESVTRLETDRSKWRTRKLSHFLDSWPAAFRWPLQHSFWPAERTITMEELVYGVFKPEAIATFQRVMERMKNEGCDAVILGCTEIPLLMDDTNSPLPTLDSTRLLARVALRRAVQAKAVPAY